MALLLILFNLFHFIESWNEPFFPSRNTITLYWLHQILIVYYNVHFLLGWLFMSIKNGSFLYVSSKVGWEVFSSHIRSLKVNYVYTTYVGFFNDVNSTLLYYDKFLELVLLVIRSVKWYVLAYFSVGTLKCQPNRCSTINMNNNEG